MTPQKQTIFTTDKTPGNCFSACLASIMDLPIGDVPHFSASDDWIRDLIQFLKQDGRFELNGSWHVKDGLNRPNWKQEFKGIDGYVIVGGGSPRGGKNGHAVIYKEGEPFFDPHPDNTFITEERDVYLIERCKGNSEEGFFTEDAAAEYVRERKEWWGSNLVGWVEEKNGKWFPCFNVWD